MLARGRADLVKKVAVSEGANREYNEVGAGFECWQGNVAYHLW